MSKKRRTAIKPAVKREKNSITEIFRFRFLVLPQRGTDRRQDVQATTLSVARGRLARTG
jgi:hypothetical protein